MKKRTLWKRIRYWFDCTMSKGPIAMSMLLLSITLAAVGIIGLVSHFVSDGSGILSQIWKSLLHILDPGNLSEAPTGNIPYLLLMTLATLCGLILTSVLISIISTGVENKLSDLRKGISVVQEDNHTIVVGFDSNTLAILRELIEANANQKDMCVVVLGEQPKIEMEDIIADQIPDTKTTRIICRSGNLYEACAFERCSVETSKSVIINIPDDVETIKVLLASASYVRGKTLTNPNLRFISSLESRQYLDEANIAGEGRSEILYTKGAIARIIANTCRQHGLSQVFTELFNYNANELYFESVPQLLGKTFREATLSFSNAVAVGMFAEGKVRLNPPMDTVIEQNDQLILLELDDGTYRYHPARDFDEAKICNNEKVSAEANDHLIILGSNDKLPLILAEYAKYVRSDTHIIIVDNDLKADSLGTYDNLQVEVCAQGVSRELLTKFREQDVNNFLLLNDDSMDAESSDSQTLLRLILLRNIADQTGWHFAITTEMRNAENQKLATQARVDDFVIGSNFASLLMSQISENPNMAALIDELLDEKGSELYMKPVANYVQTGVPVDCYTLTESVARHNEVFVGYRHMDQAKSNVIVNPDKDKPITFGVNDQIVVISEH